MPLLYPAKVSGRQRLTLRQGETFPPYVGENHWSPIGATWICSTSINGANLSSPGLPQSWDLAKVPDSGLDSPPTWPQSRPATTLPLPVLPSCVSLAHHKPLHWLSSAGTNVPSGAGDMMQRGHHTSLCQPLYPFGDANVLYGIFATSPGLCLPKCQF